MVARRRAWRTPLRSSGVWRAAAMASRACSGVSIVSASDQRHEADEHEVAILAHRRQLVQRLHLPTVHKEVVEAVLEGLERGGDGLGGVDGLRVVAARVDLAA